jgi:hypothetical protein
MKKIGLLLITAFLLIANVHAQQQNKWRNYLDAASLRGSEFVKSGDNLWISTQGGLLRYNTITGKHNVFQPDTCAMKGVKVTSVCSDSMGGVWFATNVFGLQHFDGTTFQWIATKNSGEPLGWIRKIQLDKQGRLWMLHQTNNVGASSAAEILMFQGQQWTSYARDSIAYDLDFAVDKDGVCWNVSSDYRWGDYNHILAFDSRNGQITHFNSRNSPLRLEFQPPLLRADNIGNVWVTYGNRDSSTKLFLHQLKLQNWRSYTFSSIRNVYGPYDFSFDNQGGMHIQSSDYYFTFKDSSWLVRGNDYYYASYMYVDATKSWAIGGPTYIGHPPIYLIKIDNNNRQLISFKTDKTLPNESERSYPIFGNHAWKTDLHCRNFDFDGKQFKPNQLDGRQGAFDGDSLLWMAHYDFITYLDFRTNSTSSISTQRIGSDKILVDKFKNKWIFGPTYFKGLYTISPDRTISFFDIRANGFGSSITDFAIDTAGNVWALCDSGLIKRNALTQTWSIKRLPDSVRVYGVQYINIDEGNHIWLNANGLCVQYSEQNGVRVLEYQEVSIPRFYNFENVFDRFVTYRNGFWWFAARNGLVRYDGVNYQKFDGKNSPMATKDITGVFTDRLGNLWMNHPYGLTVYNEKGLVDLATSSKEIAKQEDIPHRLFPNPMSNQGTLTFQNPNNSVFKLRIFTVNGGVIERQETSSNQFVIQNKGLAAGIYFYQIENNGRFGQGKFVAE